MKLERDVELEDVQEEEDEAGEDCKEVSRSMNFGLPKFSIHSIIFLIGQFYPSFESLFSRLRNP